MFQTQQQQNTLQDAVFLASVTPMLPGTRWHMHRQDFEDIADKAGADCLRFFENETNRRIRRLREKHGIPLSELPARDDLWIDASCRVVEAETLHAKSKSKFAECLLDETGPSEHATKSLVQLGYLSRHRIIARPRDGDIDWQPKTTRYVDIIGEFIVVLDDRGNYMGNDGSQGNAVCDGGVVTRQYRYEIEAVNAAIYARPPYFYAPPEPLKRWPSTIRQSDSLRQREATPAQTAILDAGVDRGSASQSGVSISADEADVFHTQHNTASHAVSRESTVLSLHLLESLQNAKWCEETLIGLISFVLSVPVQDQIDEDVWNAEWFKPAERLITRTTNMAAVSAWRYIEAVVRFMLSEQSWWSAPYTGDPKLARARKTPITLRHVANNFADQHAKMTQLGWQPSTATPYNGPIVETDYSAGYTGAEERQEASSCEEEVIEVVAGDGREVPPDLEASKEGAVATVVGMDGDELIELRRQIVEDYPEETLFVGDAPVAPGLSILFIEYALQRYLEFRNLDEYLGMPPECLLVIEEQAIPYARARLAQSGAGPPGVGDDPEESEGGP